MRTIPARHNLFSIFAVVAIAIVLAGFGRTFFLRFLFASSRMPGYLHVHGFLFSSWFVLFFIRHRSDQSPQTAHSYESRLGAQISFFQSVPAPACLPTGIKVPFSFPSQTSSDLTCASGNNQRPHHIVLFVFQNMAMPDILVSTGSWAQRVAHGCG
jgi:hypothetical protein